MKKIFHLCFFLFLVFWSRYSFSALKDNPGGFCTNFDLPQIPVGNFQPPLTMPLTDMRVTQNYHTSKEEGWCTVGKNQYEGSSSFCVGQKINFGHDGLDLHAKGAAAGEMSVFAPQPGLIVASHWKFYIPGWGDSIIIAARTNRFSAEILTFHLHHLHSGGTSREDYWPTRQVNPCDQVSAGQYLAREGGTSNWPTHLHISIKRWKNVQELLNKINQDPKGFFGSGYTYGNDALVSNYLNPKGYFFDFFREFQDLQPAFTDWQWAYSYTQFMRNQGWEFGLFDGKFGVSQPVEKREAARWLKIALELPDYNSGQQLFWDLPIKDTDYSYIDTLLFQQHPVRIINPWHSCTGSGQYFCPDANLSRVEALKMIIAGFYQEDFLSIYNNWVWKASAPLAGQLLSKFTDVKATEWYAPYVYYGTLVGFVKTGGAFNPGYPVTRAEFAKWLSTAYLNRHGGVKSFCSGFSCPSGYYCDEINKNCRPIPECLPSETVSCPLGGVYEGSATQPDSFMNDAESSSDTYLDSGIVDSTFPDSGPADSYSVDSVFPETPDSAVQDSSFVDVFDSADTADSSVPADTGSVDSGSVCSCISGICCDGCHFLFSSQVCSTKTEYHCASFNPGDDVESRLRTTYCSGISADCNGYESVGSWLTYQDCSPLQICSHPTGLIPVCQNQSCTDQYYSSPAGSSCYNNTGASGSPTICLETKQISGSNWQYRFCKQGNPFSNNFSYQLIDLNHSSHYLDNGSLPSGMLCSVWKSLSFSYLTQNGSANGAGLRVEILSPSSCVSAGCTYYTGMTTVYKNCL